MSLRAVVEGLDQQIGHWYEAERNELGLVNRNVMTVGLIMCDHMARHFPLDESEWFTGSQVRGLSSSRIQKILRHHGESRLLAREAGRTSRGSQDLARKFQHAINTSSLAPRFEALNADERREVVVALQGRMVERIVVDFFDQRRLEFEFQPHEPTSAVVEQLLLAARDRGGNAVGAVAQHLVGAKLAVRHPDLSVTNESYTTADEQTGRAGDFVLNTAAIHVTAVPGEQLIARCRDNLAAGMKPIVLTVRERVEAVRGLAANLDIARSVTALAIEEFVAGNVDEMAEYKPAAVVKCLRSVLETYNTRVAAVEPDPSLLIDIPPNLLE